MPGASPHSPKTTRTARASHTLPNGTPLRRILRCVLYADFNRLVMSTRKPGASASSWRTRRVVDSHARSAASEAARDAPPTSGLPPAVAAVAASAAASAAADFAFRPDDRSKSKGGTHPNSAREAPPAPASSVLRASRALPREPPRAPRRISVDVPPRSRARRPRAACPRSHPV